jgi:pimeloyl-ACP methyl ester carboxylesterase
MPRVNREVDPERVRRFMQEVMRPWQLSSIEQFQSQVRRGRVVTVDDGHHHIFFSHPRLVAQEILSFAQLGEPGGSTNRRWRT